MTTKTVWHLFYIEAQTSADTCDGHIHGYLASALSESTTKAQELAEAAVIDSIDVPAEEDITYGDYCPDDICVTHCRYLGVSAAGDVFVDIGELVS